MVDRLKNQWTGSATKRSGLKHLRELVQTQVSIQKKLAAMMAKDVDIDKRLIWNGDKFSFDTDAIDIDSVGAEEKQLFVKCSDCIVDSIYSQNKNDELQKVWSEMIEKCDDYSGQLKYSQKLAKQVQSSEWELELPALDKEKELGKPVRVISETPKSDK